MRKRRELEEYREWERTAELICLVYNVHRGKNRRALKTADILKNPFEYKQDAQDIARFFKELTLKQGGKVNGDEHAKY